MNRKSNLKTLLMLALVVLLCSNSNIAQNVGISETLINAHSSSLLELQSSERGFLLPRMTTAERDNIVSPALSLMIFNTTTNCLEIYVEGWHEISCPGSKIAMCGMPRPATGFNNCGDSFVYFGQLYATVQIGSQCWMAENLNVGTLVDVTITQTNNEIIEKHCYNNTEDNCAVYGGLYQWNEAMCYSPSSSTNPSGVQGICPDGWHLPSDAEWKVLEMHLGMSQAEADGTGFRGTDEGQKLAGNEPLWTDDVLDGHGTPPAHFNQSGFTALPSGCSYEEDFHNVTHANFLITATEDDTVKNWRRAVSAYHTNVSRAPLDKAFGNSVRCLKD